MNAEILILLLRLATVGIGVMKEIEALIMRVNAGEEITDAEIDEGSQRAVSYTHLTLPTILLV